jgi:blue copper oxidase
VVGVSRRHLLLGMVGMPLLASGCRAGSDPPASAPTLVPALPPSAFDRPLPVPPLADGRVDAAGVRHFQLTAAAGTTQIRPGLSTPTWGYDGSVLGPTIRARRGETVSVEVTNDLAEETTVHWHGMHLPARLDGGPHQPIEAGGVWTPAWTVDQPAATLWYHPHVHGSTEKQVYRGLAGLFVVDDDETAGAALPGRYGVDDIPLIVQDKRLRGDGTLDESDSEEFGLLGDVIVTNGIAGAFVTVPRGRVRLRVLNGSTARIYNLGFTGDHDFQIVASDGGLLAGPVATNRVKLSPGERVELVVEVPDTPFMLRSFPLSDDAGLGADAARFGLDRAFDVLLLRPTGARSRDRALPAVLAAIDRLDPATASEERHFNLEWYEINDDRMEMNRIDFAAAVDSVEVWTVENTDDWPHNFHVHDVQFQVIDIDAQAPPAHLAGWKDTVYVAPGSVVRLIMRFADFSDPVHTYMFHCHMLKHEDRGMMGQFLVLGPGQRPTPMA